MNSFKKIIVPILLVIVFIIAVGILIRKLQGLTPLPGTLNKTPTPSSYKIVKIGSALVKAEIAETTSQRRTGLSGRKSLEKNSGMLFTVDKVNPTPSFWMKDMKFAIDIIWIKGGKIIQIDKSVEPPTTGTADNKLKLYSPKSQVDYVLEVSSGYSDLNNIKLNDSVLME